MIIGTSTRAVRNLPTMTAIDFVAETGFDHIELWTEYPHLCLDAIGEEEIGKIRQRLDAHGLGVSVHAPIRDINPSSLNDGIRKESLRQIKDAIRFASKVEAPIVVIHPGRRTSQKDPIDQVEKVLDESLEELVNVAAEEAVTIALENMEVRAGEYVTSAEALAGVIERIDSPHLKATFDLAHANTALVDLAEFYEIIQEHVVHVHLSDNTGPGGTTHSAIGEGNVDFEKILSRMHQAGYQGALTIEGYNPLDPEGTTMKNYAKLRKMVTVILG